MKCIVTTVRVTERLVEVCVSSAKIMRQLSDMGVPKHTGRKQNPFHLSVNAYMLKICITGNVVRDAQAAPCFQFSLNVSGDLDVKQYREGIEFPNRFTIVASSHTLTLN